MKRLKALVLSARTIMCILFCTEVRAEVLSLRAEVSALSIKVDKLCLMLKSE